MTQVVRSPKVYDVCIIGSGAAGGTAAKVLTEGGLNVVMLEAGPPVNPEKDYKEHVWPYQLQHRGGGIGGKLNILCVPSRMAILTKPLNGRAACHYCGQCGRGCLTASNFSSSQVMIPPAQATGRLTLITNAMVREIVVGKDGKGEAAAYID